MEQPRSVPLVDGVVNELNGFSKIRNPAKSLIFASKTAFGKIDINKAWNEALKQANIEGFVFHSIRHHFATLLLALEQAISAQNCIRS